VPPIFEIVFGGVMWMLAARGGESSLSVPSSGGDEDAEMPDDLAPPPEER
jgi:hypothetical protein